MMKTFPCSTAHVLFSFPASEPSKITISIRNSVIVCSDGYLCDENIELLL